MWYFKWNSQQLKQDDKMKMYLWVQYTVYKSSAVTSNCPTVQQTGLPIMNLLFRQETKWLNKETFAYFHNTAISWDMVLMMGVLGGLDHAISCSFPGLIHQYGTKAHASSCIWQSTTLNIITPATVLLLWALLICGGCGPAISFTRSLRGREGGEGGKVLYHVHPCCYES